jgi:isopentenyl diphosphate isomerase/L-lactate dehydrogenase-like FMN-dependent dehydrogenase
VSVVAASPRFATATDIVRHAHEALTQPVWDYVSGGTESETTKRRNRDALDAWAFRPRVLRNVSELDCSTTLLGTELRIPILLAPVASLQTVHPHAAAASVRAAGRFGTVPIVSAVSEPGLEASAKADPGAKWFQLYIRGDWDATREVIGRARDAGYAALVVTVDAPVYSQRERPMRHGWLPPSKTNPQLRDEYQALLDWDVLATLRQDAGMPIVLKGIQTIEDAQIAADAGIDALYLSNHGGRQLDHARPVLRVLCEVVERRGSKLPLIVDGWIARGLDALKAIALGADAVAIGRMQAYALAAGGEAGVTRLLEILEVEIRTAMAMIGITRLAELSSSHVEFCGVPSGTDRPFPLLPPDIVP